MRLDFAETFDRVHPEDRADRDGAIQQALQTRGEYEVEYRVQQSDGMARWIHGRGRCVEPDDGSGPKLFGVSMDVTARKQTEASAEAKLAELEHVARVATLGELTATLTHEIKQPLTVIGLNAYIGVRLLDTPEPDIQQVRATLAEICEVTERAGEVIEGLRAMLKRDGTATDLTSVDVNEVIRIVERIVHGDANLHRVAVHVDLSSDVGPVKGDSVQLQQVILTLMINAFSAMSGTGLEGPRRLVVRTTRLMNRTRWSKFRTAALESRRTSSNRSSIPSPPASRKDWGMGLSICRSVIERHGGRISAANNRDPRRDVLVRAAGHARMNQASLRASIGVIRSARLAGPMQASRQAASILRPCCVPQSREC